MWIFATVSSIILVILEFLFIHDIKTTTVYNCLQNKMDERQQARYFTNLILVLTICLHICLQIKIKNDHSKSTDPFFDICLIFQFVIFFMTVVFVYNFVKPNIRNVPIRGLLQITFVDCCIIRLLRKSRNSIMSRNMKKAWLNVACA